MNTPNQMTLE